MVRAAGQPSGAGRRLRRAIGCASARGRSSAIAARPGICAARPAWWREIHGTFRNPEQLAYHKPGLPAQVLYKVRFKQGEIWGRYAGPAGDHLEADIYEHWLEPLK